MAMTNESDSDTDTSSSNSKEEEDDPRIVAMFQIAAASNSSNGPADDVTRPRELHISEHSILDCFQRALNSHGNTDPGAYNNGIWKAPSLFKMENAPEDETACSVADWKPASLPLPTWVVRPPAEVTSPSNN